ncbi:MAG: hypothetical protein ABI787_10715 [Spartobacteria bacterium]
MKAILGSLLCYILFASQCFALKGGPFDGGGKGQVTTTGTFAGILLPESNGVGSNTLGLFTLIVPSTGLATGNATMFGFGAAMTGTVQGAADPKTAKLYAILNMEFDITVAISDTERLIYAYLANGKLDGNKIVPGKNGFSTRITGTSNITFSASPGAQQYLPGFPDNTTVTYTVLGFKQA